MNLYCAQAKCLQGRYAHHFMSAIAVFVVCSICLFGCKEGSSPPMDMETTPDTATEMNMRPDADAVEDEGVSERRPMNRDANDEMTETTDIFSTTPQDAEPQSSPDMSVDSQVIQDATPVICQPTDCLETPENTVHICEHTHQLKVTACEAQQNGQCAWTTIPCSESSECLDGRCALGCHPGEELMGQDDCNWCTCGADGFAEDAECTQFDCNETGCRRTADCAPNQFCDFEDDRCALEGRRGRCREADTTCQVLGMAVCGCDGTYGVDECSIQSASSDIFEFGGCLIPDLGGAFACGPSVCMSTQHYCRIDVNPNDPDGFPLTSCEPIPEDCNQGDCRCFVAKNPEYACFSGGGLVVLVPRTRDD